MATDGFESLVNFYSMGIVAAPRKRNSERIEVWPVEQVFMNGGKVGDEQATVEISHASSNGQDTVQVKLGRAVPALWWKFNSNRITPPNVEKGDQVLIYRVGDTDVFFWVDLNNMNVKKAEDVVYAWAADNNNQMADDLSNAWMLNVSPMDGHFTFRTSLANNEQVAYIFQFNPRDGFHLVKDDQGNGYYINSIEDDVGFYNGHKSKVNIIKEKCFIYASELIELETKKLSMKYTEKVEKGETVSVTAPEQTHTGDVTIKGNEHITGNWTLDGDGTAASGRLTAANATIGGSDYVSHTHKAQGEYAITTPPQNLGKVSFKISEPKK